MSNRLEEAVAKALHEHGTGPGYEWNNASEDERQKAFAYARVAIETVKKHDSEFCPICGY